MFTQIREFIDNIREPRVSFALQDLEGFPYDEYNRNLTHYTELERWHSGDALDETVERQGKEVELYPVKINPLPRSIEQHTYFLFGQVKQDDRPLVYPKINPLEYSNQEQVKDAKKLEDILYRIWSESNGRAIQWTNGAISQLYGGCVFRLVYDPFDPLRTIPIRIESIHPKSCVIIPDGTDLWRVREAWIVRAINHSEAQDHGVDISISEQPWMVEHFTKSFYECSINGQPAKRFVNGEWQELSGPNYWGFVPIVYIPHIRVYGFYGETFVDNVIGIIKELNLRLADFGDAVTRDAHTYLGMRNVNGAPTIQQIAPGLYAVNLHSSPMITGGEAEPDLFTLGSATASEPMENLVDLLWKIYRRLASIPAVADGEDEGSQRSAATLVTRMLALISHTDIERIFWSTGLNLLARMMIKMLMLIPDITRNVEVSPDFLVYPVRHEWAPVLPRDREVVVQEVVALMAAHLGSIERLLDLLGVDNPSEERDLIMKDLKEIAETESKAAAKAQPPQAKGVKGSSVSASQGTPAREKNQEGQ